MVGSLTRDRAVVGLSLTCVLEQDVALYVLYWFNGGMPDMTDKILNRL